MKHLLKKRQWIYFCLLGNLVASLRTNNQRDQLIRDKMNKKFKEDLENRLNIKNASALSPNSTRLIPTSQRFNFAELNGNKKTEDIHEELVKLKNNTFKEMLDKRIQSLVVQPFYYVPYFRCRFSRPSLNYL